MMRFVAWAALVFLLLATAVGSLAIGNQTDSPLTVLAALFTPESVDPATATIIRDMRVPRVMLGIIVGAALGAAGAGYQGLFRNPLADPFIIGASSGASLGITVAVLAGWQLTALGLGPISLAGMAGALLTVWLVYAIASVAGEVPMLSLLLAGIAVSSFLGAVVAIMMLLHDEHLITIFSSILGTLSGDWNRVTVGGGIIIPGLLVLWSMSRPLDVLGFGDDAAQSLGLSLTRVRIALVVTASVITAAAVAAAGVIGFVGLIAPHVARMFVGPRHHGVVPASCLVGAILLLISDDLARTVFAPTEIPVSLVSALLGGPFFLYLLKSRSTRWGTN